jgi:hypothetical protein
MSILTHGVTFGEMEEKCKSDNVQNILKNMLFTLIHMADNKSEKMHQRENLYITVAPVFTVLIRGKVNKMRKSRQYF